MGDRRGAGRPPGIRDVGAFTRSDVFRAAAGHFAAPSRPDALAIQCLAYGSGTPPVWSLTEAGQGAQPGELNQIRFGQIPEAFAGGVDGVCARDAGTDPAFGYPESGFGASGFGFRGAQDVVPAGDWFEIGRFWHFNRIIERGARAVDLRVEFDLDGPDGPVVLAGTYVVSVDETSDHPGVADTTLCTYDVPENAVVSAPGVATLCADRVTFAAPDPLTAAIGATSVRVDVGGFAPVVDEACDLEQAVAGAVVFTAEQARNPFCLFGVLEPGAVELDLALPAAVAGSLDLVVETYDERTGARDRSTTWSVDVAGGVGTFSGSGIGPGLYRIDGVAGSSGLVPAGVVCEEGDATIVLDGETYLDVDSGETVRCALRLDPPQPTTTVTTVTSPAPSATSSSTAPRGTDVAADVDPRDVVTSTSASTTTSLYPYVTAPISPGRRTTLPATGGDGTGLSLVVATMLLLAGLVATGAARRVTTARPLVGRVPGDAVSGRSRRARRRSG